MSTTLIGSHKMTKFHFTNPKYIFHLLFVQSHIESANCLYRFRQYGLWERYAELYPDSDLVFTVGESDYTIDWFFAHVTRLCFVKLYKADLSIFESNYRNQSNPMCYSSS